MKECPHCHSTNFVKNGKTYYGKQNHKCKYCKRQFVERSAPKLLDLVETVRKLLLERISLRGICRAVGTSKGWLSYFIKKLYKSLPDELPIQLPEEPKVYLWLVQADEMWSFVQKKANKQWIWLALEQSTRQIVGYFVGTRGEEGALGLWLSIPKFLRQHAIFCTDNWDAYGKVFPDAQLIQGKENGLTNHLERFNNTLRQRNSRLVRKALSFSKCEENHIDSIFYFLLNYNISKFTSL